MKNFRAAISEGKSWEMELPKILMLYKRSPNQISGKASEWFCSIANFRTKLPYIEFNSNKHYQHSIANIGQNAICIKRVEEI